MRMILSVLLACLALAPALAAPAADTAAAADAQATYDAALAQRLGADARGMRHYVLVILKTGPHRMPDGEARNAMFAGPFDADAGGWRGLFLFAVADVEEAKRLTASDPVIVNGEMVAEYHAWYGS